MEESKDIIKAKLDSLNDSSIWTFAKQDTNFENIFKAVCIFDSITDLSEVNVEQYFESHSLPDGFRCNHRMLSSAQLFGLLTKNSSSYSNESVTPVFRELQNYPIGSREFNVIKSEQLLKIKIWAIINKGDNTNNHQILPVFFIFDVLYKLHECGIEDISLDQLYTYVMTCSRKEEAENCVECLLHDPPESPLTKTFASKCRMWTLITNNSKLFCVSEGRVSINPNYLEFFYNQFYMNKKNVIDAVLSSILDYREAYNAVLTTVQGLNIDLTDESPKEYIDRRSVKEDLKELPIQQITYGAPGTGKSHGIKDLTVGKSVIRTTFHPDSDYSTFVGAYKPVMEESEMHVVPVVLNNGASFEQNEGTFKEKRISYKFVKQAFLKAYLGAWKKYADSESVIEPQFLIIEEINRGNCAQIFGDLFQLLDRNDENNFSTYPIDADTDLQREIELAFASEKDGDSPNPYKLSKDIEIEGAVEDYTSNCGSTLSKDVQKGRILLLPPNLYILATMNTSDQSLFPIDSAFKRRWSWKYVKITNAKKGWTIKGPDYSCDWWTFIEEINKKIATATNSDDKKLGYFFCRPKKDANYIDESTFVAKVIFYLWNDVFKDNDNSIFNVTSQGGEPSYDDFYKETESGDIIPNSDSVKKFLINVMGEENIALSVSRTEKGSQAGQADVEQETITPSAE